MTTPFADAARQLDTNGYYVAKLSDLNAEVVRRAYRQYVIDSNIPELSELKNGQRAARRESGMAKYCPEPLGTNGSFGAVNYASGYLCNAAKDIDMVALQTMHGILSQLAKMHELTHLEIVPDRMCYRTKMQNAESAHTDNSAGAWKPATGTPYYPKWASATAAAPPKHKSTDQFFGGFVNCNADLIQKFTLNPGTHSKFARENGGEFTVLKKHNQAMFKANINLPADERVPAMRSWQHVEVPPGHMIIVYENIHHAVNATPVVMPICRKFTAFRLSCEGRQWMEAAGDAGKVVGNVARLGAAKPLMHKGGVVAPMYPAAYWTNFPHLLGAAKWAAGMRTRRLVISQESVWAMSGRLVHSADPTDTSRQVKLAKSPYAFVQAGRVDEGVMKVADSLTENTDLAVAKRCKPKPGMFMYAVTTEKCSFVGTVKKVTMKAGNLNIEEIAFIPSGNAPDDDVAGKRVMFTRLMADVDLTTANPRYVVTPKYTPTEYSALEKAKADELYSAESKPYIDRVVYTPLLDDTGSLRHVVATLALSKAVDSSVSGDVLLKAVWNSLPEEPPSLLALGVSVATLAKDYVTERSQNWFFPRKVGSYDKFAVDFAMSEAAPVVTSVEPRSNPTGVNCIVTINGENLGTCSGLRMAGTGPVRLVRKSSTAVQFKMYCDDVRSGELVVFFEGGKKLDLTPELGQASFYHATARERAIIAARAAAALEGRDT